MDKYSGKLAVLCQSLSDKERSQELADRLDVPLYGFVGKE